MDTKLWRSLRSTFKKAFGLNTYDTFRARQDENNPIQENSCPICLNNYDSADFLKTPCGHVYHQYCLEEWLQQKSECPTCRAYLPPID